MVHERSKVIFREARWLRKRNGLSDQNTREVCNKRNSNDGVIVISLVGDNTRSVQLALKTTTYEKKGILQVRCIVHINKLM